MNSEFRKRLFPEGWNYRAPVERIELGRDFSPFDPKYTQIELGEGHLYVIKVMKEYMGVVENPGGPTLTTIESNKALLIPGIKPFLPVNFSTQENGDLVPCFTPFDPESGYKVTEDDYDEARYIEKMAQFKSPVDILDRFPFSFWGDIGFDVGSESRIYRKYVRRSLQIAETLSQIRLRLSFSAGLVFESSPWIHDYEFRGRKVRALEFTRFYQLTEKPARISSHLLRLPNDIEQLAQIRGTFVLES